MAYSSSQSQDTPESCPQKKPVFQRFFGKKSFPCKTVDFHLKHVLQILKAIGPEVNLSYQSSLSKPPTSRQNFANTLQPHCAHYLTLRPRWFPDMWVPELLLPPKINKMFGPKTTFFCPKKCFLAGLAHLVPFWLVVVMGVL